MHKNVKLAVINDLMFITQEDKWLDLAIMTRHSDDTLNISNS